MSDPTLSCALTIGDLHEIVWAAEKDSNAVLKATEKDGGEVHILRTAEHMATMRLCKAVETIRMRRQAEIMKQEGCIQ